MPYSLIVKYHVPHDPLYACKPSKHHISSKKFLKAFEGAEVAPRNRTFLTLHLFSGMSVAYYQKQSRNNAHLESEKTVQPRDCHSKIILLQYEV